MVDSMTELDNRLRAVIEFHAVRQCEHKGCKYPICNHGINNMLLDIKQAFIDAGYMRPPNLTEEQAMDELEKRL